MAAFNNCLFLYMGKEGICPYMKNKKKCTKKCDRFAEVGDANTQIFKDWDYEIEELRKKFRTKYFPEYKEPNEFNDIDWE